MLLPERSIQEELLFMKNKKGFLSLLPVLLLVMSILCIPVSAFADPAPISGQLDFIYASLGNVAQNDGETWYYAVTDFDRNGRLEIVAASARDYSTSVLVWEVSENCDELKRCGFLLGKDESYPDILTDSADTYHYEDSDTWYYVFNDAVNNAGSYFRNKCSVNLLGGNFIYKLLASQTSEFTNGLTVITFADANGTIIDQNEFDAAEKSAFTGAVKSSTSLGWFKFSAAQLSSDVLSDSYAVFTGDRAPDENSVIHENDGSLQMLSSAPVLAETPDAEPVSEPVPTPEIVEYSAAEPDLELYYYDGVNFTPMNGAEPLQPSGSPSEDLPIVKPSGNTPIVKPSAGTPVVKPSDPEIIYVTPGPQQIEIVYPTPTPTPKPVFLTVTRNPTNELRRVGDTARFVACANAIDSLSWTIVDPSGTPVSASAFMGMFPGSSVDGSSTTLSITNVTEGMAGWGAYCTFYTKDGQSASTSTAYITMK